MKNKLAAILSPILFAVVLIIGIYIGKSLNHSNEQAYSNLFKVDKLHALLNYLEQDYVDSLSQEDLIELAIPKILEQLDPHSVYIPATEMAEMNEPIEGNFDGIGIMFNIQNDTIMVINTIHGGPSEKVGVMAGDRIVLVDDSLFAGKHISNQMVMKALKGPSGTEVNIKVKRQNYDKLLAFTIKRDKIPIKSVDVAYAVTPDVAYLKISQFGMNTYKEFISEITKYQKQGIHSWIIDLRGNGGGIMQAAVQIADEFLNKGQLIVYTQGRSKPRENIYASSTGLCQNDKVVILIDEWSASASEILAGALQDNDRGTIVGRRSFGKGLVQEPSQFPDGSGLRLTIARYYTPTGRCIQKDYKSHNEYFADINQRYENGEFAQADSIHFADSLKYKTPKGKIVYGGGGIMPDAFVPVDTAGYSPYFRDLVAGGHIYKFAFEYTDQNRSKLRAFNNFQTLTRYLESIQILDKLNAYAKSKGIRMNPQDLQTSKRVIETHLKAYIVRNIFDDQGFYPIILTDDKTVGKAIEMLKN